TAQWSAKSLDVFGRDFAKWLRGDARVKDDRAIAASDIADYNLILFGDPRSNSVIGRIVDRLPVRWTQTEIAVGAQTFGAADHIPVLIYPNPLNPKRYVVINSGHTFGDEDFRGTNAWLYPRLGDYAVMNGDGTTALSGFFDERWRLPPGGGATALAKEGVNTSSLGVFVAAAVALLVVPGPAVAFLARLTTDP